MNDEITNIVLVIFPSSFFVTPVVELDECAGGAPSHAPAGVTKLLDRKELHTDRQSIQAVKTEAETLVNAGT